MLLLLPSIVIHPYHIVKVDELLFVGCWLRLADDGGWKTMKKKKKKSSVLLVLMKWNRQSSFIFLHEPNRTQLTDASFLLLLLLLLGDGKQKKNFFY